MGSIAAQQYIDIENENKGPSMAQVKLSARSVVLS